MTHSPSFLISKKRDGLEHTAEEIGELISLFMSDRLTDYQMTAWLMAAFLNGLSDKETIALTSAMLHSGRVLDHESLKGPKIDKHSTGGVGDKISLPLAPLVAACGVIVPMISGRGLGHTGGTLDKLESIPGYDVRLTRAKQSKALRKAGASINGQTKDIAPADARIYALRDVTGTVACRPLIVASILSKKLAAGLDGLVLDVKVGRGAFMKSEPDARALAKSLVKVSAELGTPAVALLTRMDAPLGRTIGNALEVREAIDILSGEGPPDTTELTLLLGEQMLLLGGVAETRREAGARLRAALDSGQALERLERMIALHGGDASVVAHPEKLPRAPFQLPVAAAKGGFVSSIDSLALAEIALSLGAGRLRAEDRIDHAVGIEILAAPGTRVERGAPLALLHARSKDAGLTRGARAAFTVGPREPQPQPLLLGKIGARRRSRKARAVG